MLRIWDWWKCVEKFSRKSWRGEQLVHLELGGMIEKEIIDTGEVNGGMNLGWYGPEPRTVTVFLNTGINIGYRTKQRISLPVESLFPSNQNRILAHYWESNLVIFYYNIEFTSVRM